MQKHSTPLRHPIVLVSPVHWCECMLQAECAAENNSGRRCGLTFACWIRANVAVTFQEAGRLWHAQRSHQLSWPMQTHRLRGERGCKYTWYRAAGQVAPRIQVLSKHQLLEIMGVLDREFSIRHNRIRPPQIHHSNR